jgi:hypothetical protein
LSDVKWNYDGTLLDADEEDFAAQLINLPDGLVANYQTVSSEDAEALCTDYRTIVTFTLDTEKYPELANYYIPTEDGGNYINEGSSFSFELDWAKAAPLPSLIQS